MISREKTMMGRVLFNPSIVLHPDQSDLPAGHVRFIMSLRATGEGHVLPIVFRRPARSAGRASATSTRPANIWRK
jgi:hypothetical protein